jgi:Fic family protein
MKVINPPKLPSVKTAFEEMHSSPTTYREFMKPIDEKGRYLHWDELRHRIGKDVKPDIAWWFVKTARKSGGKNLPFRDKKGRQAYLFITDFMQRVCSQVDRLTSSAAEKEMMQGLDGRDYFIKELFGEESISSSQLEGAATTTRIAKEMLQVQRQPRNTSEKMIFGNYKMMQFVAAHADEKLSIELIKKIHTVGVSGISDEEYQPGSFRDNDKVVVEDTETGDTIHEPPSHTEIDGLSQTLCDWANEPHEKNLTGSYLHPLVKACVLHFMIGYIHPFSDGNGRTARALFYWYMLKCGYSAFKHISISRLLKNAPTAYVKSYIYTETDEFDFTYFVSYQCNIISKAVEAYVEYIKQVIKTRAELMQWLWEGGVSQKLNARQREIMTVAVSDPGRLFTISEAITNLGVSYNTARKDFNELVELGLLKSHKDGRETVFISPKNIKQAKKWTGEESLPDNKW